MAVHVRDDSWYISLLSPPQQQGRYAYTTATARTTPSKKCVYILVWNFPFNWNYPMCLSVLKVAPAEYAKNAFSSK